MSWEQRNHDFSTAQVDAQVAYIEAEREVKRLEAENAKLRRLVHRIISHVEHPPCEGCLAEMSCDGEHVTQCDEWLFMVADARKLGIEVDA